MSSLRKARAELQKLQDQVAAKSPIPKSGITRINDDLNETRCSSPRTNSGESPRVFDPSLRPCFPDAYSVKVRYERVRRL
jgi:hypothetical protein